MKIKYQYTIKNGNKLTEALTRKEAEERLEKLRMLKAVGNKYAPTYYGTVDFNRDQEIAAIEAAL